MHKNTPKKEIIGSLHLLPLPGSLGFGGNEKNILENAKKDLESFQSGGIDSIIIENNFDLPHVECIKEETYQAFLRISEILVREISVPFGFSVLWNDYKSALKLAKALNGTYIRIPVFVDTVETDFGVMKANPKDVLTTRELLEAHMVKIYTDIHVKHARILNSDSITDSASHAVRNGTDGIIITGSWTGIAPDLRELKDVKNTAESTPIIAGSGISHENIIPILQFADKVIVSTSLKEGFTSKKERNRTSQLQRIDSKKVEKLMKIVRSSVDRV